MSHASAQAHYFGRADAPLFGWWHAAENPTGLAMVLCSPIGREEISAHRSLRHLAEMLAQRGVPTLRFDYAGTGDSCGSSLDADQLRACGDSLHCAIDEARRLSGVSHVALGGLRIGALLATQAALARDDVAALIAMVPVVNGRTWIRELKAMQAAAASDPIREDASIFDSGGFAMSATARDAIGLLDLRSPERAPAPHILILDRADLPTQRPWADKLAALGAHVERLEVPGYDRLMLDPHRAEVPVAMLQAACTWIAPLAAAAAPARPLAPLSLKTSATLPRLREAACRIEADGGHLNAIETTPLATVATGQAIILLNAGAIRRVGPGRLHVDLARRLALQGHRVIRVDLMGLGDSRAAAGRDENIVYTDTALREVNSIVGHMRQHDDVRHCVGIGLCAGGYHAFKAAVMGAQFDTVVLINPLTFFWHAGMPLDPPLPRHKVVSEMNRYQRDLLSVDRFRKLLRGDVDLRRLSRLIGKWLYFKLATPAREVARRLHIPLHDDLAGEMALLAGRNVRMQFVFGADEPGRELLAMQGGGMVGKLQKAGSVEIKHFDAADHIFSGWAVRQDLIESLAESFAPRP